MNDTPETNRSVGRIVGPRATAADIDAAMLADLRAWQRRNSPETLAKNGVRLDAAEFDLLMRLADKATEQADPVTERSDVTVDGYRFDPFGELDFGPLPEPSECTHDESTIVNGGLVCGSCGKLIAWIIFKRLSA